jgi:HK97 family phage portal protein
MRPQPTLFQLAAATLRRFTNAWRVPYPWGGSYYAGNRRIPGSYCVTPYTAMSYSVVWACQRVIAETLAMLPWRVYELRPDDTMVYRSDNAANYLLQRRPNPDTPAMIFREHVVMQMLAWGNAYAQIEWNNAHQPIALWQIPSGRVRVDRDDVGNLIYIVCADALNPEMVIKAENMLHWRNVGFDGLMGMSTISLASQTISYGKEMELFGARAMQNAPFLGGWLETPDRMNEEQAKRFKASWREKYMGWLNAGETPILEGGLKFTQAQLPLADAQFLESRVFQAQEICRWYRVPQHKVGLLEEASYANIEPLEIDFVNETCLPMATRLQQELDYKLFEGAVKTSKFFTRHDLTPVLKGALKDRFEAYSVALRYGWYSINDVLQAEGMNKIDGGDLRTVQLNTVPLSQFESLAEVKLQQARADVEYRETQTEQLEAGISAADAADDGSADGSADSVDGDGSDDGQNEFEPTQAANPPGDELKQATQAAKRLRILEMGRGQLRTDRALVPQPNDLGVDNHGNHNASPPARRSPAPDGHDRNPLPVRSYRR